MNGLLWGEKKETTHALTRPPVMISLKSKRLAVYSTMYQSSARISLWEASHIWKLPSTHFIWR